MMLQLSCIWQEDCSFINCLTHSDFNILTGDLVPRCCEFSPTDFIYCYSLPFVQFS